MMAALVGESAWASAEWQGGYAWGQLQTVNRQMTHRHSCADLWGHYLTGTLCRADATTDSGCQGMWPWHWIHQLSIARVATSKITLPPPWLVRKVGHPTRLRQLVYELHLDDLTRGAASQQLALSHVSYQADRAAYYYLISLWYCAPNAVCSEGFTVLSP
jgi:hypothetical protein